MNPTEEKNFYEFGKQQEESIFETIKNYFGNVVRTTEKYADWDYEDNEKKLKIELKSRRNKSNQYNTTILGSNKIFKGRKLMKEGWDIVYLFNFTDKIMFYELDLDDDFYRNYFNNKYHSHIPIDKLKILD